jgi:hypothetical protein
VGGAAVDGGQLERGVSLLREALAAGPLPAAEVVARLARQGVSRRTVFRARAEAGVLSEVEKTPTGLRSLWRLAPPTELTPAQHALKLLNAKPLPHYLDGH